MKRISTFHEKFDFVLIFDNCEVDIKNNNNEINC